MQAALATGVATTLADPAGRFTLFAPNDRAFMRLVADLSGTHPASEAEALNTAVAALGVEKIKNVLLYHAVAGKVLNPLQVLLSRSLTMANGGTVKVRGINLRDETDALKDPKLVLWALNIKASNGVIHTIDRVLSPPAPPEPRRFSRRTAADERVNAPRSSAACTDDLRRWQLEIARRAPLVRRGVGTLGDQHAAPSAR